MCIRDRLDIAEEADVIAEKRYKTSVETFKMCIRDRGVVIVLLI